MRLCTRVVQPLLFALALVAASPMAAATESDGQAQGSDIPLSEALEALRLQGMNLIFSNALVLPRYKVRPPTDATLSPEARAIAMLKPFGLGLEKIEPDTFYVVALSADGPPQEVVEDADVDPRRLIEQVLVSSSRYRLVRELQEQRRLEQQDLHAIPSVGRDLLRAINQLPGQATSGVSARNYIRGGNSDEVLYLVDGVELIEPFHLGDFQALFTAVNPGLVDAVNIYSAGFPVDYGSRLSGVIDMEIQPATRPISGLVDVNLISAAASVQGYRNDIEWLASFRRSIVDEVFDGLKRDYGRPVFDDEMVRLAWAGESASWTLGALASSDELTLNDDVAGEAAEADHHNLVVWLRGDYSPGDRLLLALTTSFSRVENQRSGTLVDPVDALGSLDESSEFWVITAKPSVTWRLNDRWRLHAGVEGQFQDANFEFDLVSHYGPLGVPIQPQDPLQRSVSAERDGFLVAGFLSLQQFVDDRLQVEYGIRYDAQDMDPVHDHQLSPRLQVNYQATPDLSLFANLGRYAQHENLYELQLDNGLLELSVPQIADQLSIGLGWTAHASLELRLEGYLRTVDDPRPRFENLYNPWVLLPELHADRFGLMPDKARARGVELSLRYEPSRTLSWNAALAYAKSEERLLGDWRSRPWDQRYSAHAGLDWRPDRWQISLNGTWHGGWPNTSLLTAPPTTGRRLYDQRLKDYLSLDLRLARRFEIARSTIDVYLDLTNATSYNNVGGYRYELDDAVLVPDERRLLPTIPALGFTWTW